MTTYSIEWIRDFSHCKNASFIDTSEVTVFYNNTGSTSEKIIAKSIISFDGLCLVSEINGEDNWLMGQINDDGKIIDCWGYCGSLPDAINSL